MEACLGGEPDPEVLRFLRLSLPRAGRVLLEPIFSNEVWNHLGADLAGERGGGHPGRE